MKPSPQDLLLSLLAFQKALDRTSDLFFARYGITGAQFNVLSLLCAAGGGLGQAEVVANLFVAKSSASTLLNRMVRDGLVTRRQDKKDLRQVSIALTPKGRKLQAKISPNYERKVEDIFGAAPASHCRQFLDDLQAFRDQLRLDIDEIP